MHFSRQVAALVAGGALGASVALIACFDNSSPPGGAGDAGVALDAAALPDASGLDAAAPDAGADATPPDAPSEAAPPMWPDAGAACAPPSGPQGLSAAAEGLPANGLVLWLRGDRGVYTSVDAGADAGTAVCAWVDQTSNGWLFINQGSVAASWLAAGVGGQPAVAFSSGNTTMQVDGVLGLAPTAARTFIAVETIVNGDGRFDPMLQGQRGSAGTYVSIDANTWLTAGNREGIYVTSNSIDTATATTPGSARVHVLTVSTLTPGMPIVGNVDYRVNGQSQTFTVRQGGGTIGDFSAANFTGIGYGVASSTGVPPSAIVAELLVYGRALSSAEAMTVESALKQRYGIP